MSLGAAASGAGEGRSAVLLGRWLRVPERCRVRGNLGLSDTLRTCCVARRVLLFSPAPCWPCCQPLAGPIVSPLQACAWRQRGESAPARERRKQKRGVI